MCEHCLTERPDAKGLHYTEPECEAPRPTGESRQSGWLCGACGHWHPWRDGITTAHARRLYMEG